MNILILSTGTRNKLVSYFIKEFEGKGKIICADCNKLAPTLYEVDKYYIVPRIDEPQYLDTIIEICKNENVKGIFSLIDPELSLLAKNKERFYDMGIIPFVSDIDAVEMSFDKYKFYQFCKDNGFNTIKSYIDIEEFKKDLEIENIHFPVFIKPRNGSCSVNIQKIENMTDLELNFNKYPGTLIQEYIEGQEYGVDVYIDMLSAEIVSIFTKKKLLMRAGETDKAVSVKNEKLFELISDFIRDAGYKGQIDIDIFEKDEKFYFSEVNPRFGGGYPHAYECGCNFPQYMLNNLEGKINENHIGDYNENIYMMKFLDVLIKEVI